MRKRILCILIPLLFITTIFIGCRDVQNNPIQKSKEKTLVENDYNNIDLRRLNNYIIDVEFNPNEKSYYGKQQIIYCNNEDTNLDEIYFHIYPNAFKERETAPFLFNNFDAAYPNGFEPGYIDIIRISVNDHIVQNYSIEGEGDTILKIPLDAELKPGEKVNIYMEYEVILPPAQDRFGYGDKTFNFGNWYPVVAVYDEEGWNLDPYYSIGDPFYSDTSNYQVTIKAPKDIVVSSSGNILSEKVQGDYKIWNIEAKLMRDFAWVASEYFTKIEREVDGTTIKMYFLDENEDINEFATEVACSSIQVFNDVFGKYPYGQYSVVATSFPSGMEYPGIVFIGEKYYNDYYRGYLEIVIVHETAHQWWYGVVGNDEVDEAWLDESITTYSEVIYAEEKYGSEASEKYYLSSIENGYKNRKDVIQTDEVIVKPLSEFTDWNEYGALTYDKGAVFINEIKEKYGKDVLYQILKEYYEKYKYLISTTEDFIRICEEITKDDFTEMVNYWLYGR